MNTRILGGTTTRTTPESPASGLTPGAGDGPINLTTKVTRPVMEAVARELHTEGSSRGADQQGGVLTIDPADVCDAQGRRAARGFIDALRAL